MWEMLHQARPDKELVNVRMKNGNTSNSSYLPKLSLMFIESNTWIILFPFQCSVFHEQRLHLHVKYAQNNYLNL